MASANATFTDLVATTFRNQKATVYDNVSRNNALFAQMRKKGNVRYEDGGTTIAQILDIAENAFTLDLPIDAHPIAFQMQAGQPTLWVFIPDPRSSVKRPLRFAVIGTGNPFDLGDMQYLGTIQQPPFVWHLFVEARR